MTNSDVLRIAEAKLYAVQDLEYKLELKVRAALGRDPIGPPGPPGSCVYRSEQSVLRDMERVLANIDFLEQEMEALVATRAEETPCTKIARLGSEIEAKAHMLFQKLERL